MTDFGIKELYSVTLKPTLDMKINGIYFRKNEPIITFDKIQVAYLNENKRRWYAHGGYGDRILVTWENTTSIGMRFSEGVISKTGLSMLSNSKLLTHQQDDILIPYNETIEKSELENGDLAQDHSVWRIEVKYPIHGDKENTFIRRNGVRVPDECFDIDDNDPHIIYISMKYMTEDDGIYEVYYDYEYTNEYDNLSIGERAVKGFLCLTGRTRLKDDQTGKESTALIEIPKLKLTSDLTMRLGSAVTPYIYDFSIMGYPVGDRGHEYVCRYTFLNEDIDADF